MTSSSEIAQACLALGFASAGICRARPSSHPEDLRAWLASGRHATMDWLTEYLDQRLDIRSLIPGRAALSVIMVADAYAHGDDAQPPRPSRAQVSRYARGRDYHQVIKRRLHQLADNLRARHPAHEFRSFVDTGPVLEREHAARAGLGFIGKHTLLIDPRAGSWLLLGGIATTLDLEPTAPDTDPANRCGQCTRCIDACPTSAIEPFHVDARRCLSYLTIEHEGVIPAEFHQPMAHWIFGCDVCQEVCPFNHAPHAAPRVNPAYHERPALASGELDLREVLNWSQDDRRVTLTISAGKRASLDMLCRNAVIAAGNSLQRTPDPALLAELQRLAVDPAEPELIRATARHTLERVSANPGPCRPKP